MTDISSGANVCGPDPVLIEMSDQTLNIKHSICRVDGGLIFSRLPYYYLSSVYLLATTTKVDWPSSFVPRVSSYLTTCLGANAKHGGFEYALIFDCDGVIIDTKELHRLAYNATCKSADLNIDGNLLSECSVIRHHTVIVP